MTAQELIDQLLEMEEHGQSLDVPVRFLSFYINNDAPEISGIQFGESEILLTDEDNT